MLHLNLCLWEAGSSCSLGEEKLADGCCWRLCCAIVHPVRASLFSIFNYPLIGFFFLAFSILVRITSTLSHLITLFIDQSLVLAQICAGFLLQLSCLFWSTWLSSTPGFPRRWLYIFMLQMPWYKCFLLLLTLSSFLQERVLIWYMITILNSLV